MKKFKINLSFDQSSLDRAGITNTDGYYVGDWFDSFINGIYDENTAKGIVESYKGPDVDGVEVRAEIVEVNPNESDSK